MNPSLWSGYDAVGLNACVPHGPDRIHQTRKTYMRERPSPPEENTSVDGTFSPSASVESANKAYIRRSGCLMLDHRYYATKNMVRQ